MIYIFWTTGSKEEAESVAKILLREKWIACCSILPAVTSLYTWKGKVEKDEEVKVIFKTRKELFGKVSELIEEHSSYDVSEIAAIEAVSVAAPYLSWLEESTRSS